MKIEEYTHWYLDDKLLEFHEIFVDRRSDHYAIVRDGCDIYKSLKGVTFWDDIDRLEDIVKSTFPNSVFEKRKGIRCPSLSINMRIDKK